MYILDLIVWADQYLTRLLSSSVYTSNLIITPISRFITETLIVSFMLVISYEAIYWSGIYIGLWEYHAKEIFTEIPIHCAHVYTRVNIISQDDLKKVREYYQLKQGSTFNLAAWNRLNALSNEVFRMDKFVKYHFEFSPEDFELNEDPEYGSNVQHLRQKIADLVNNSDIYNRYVESRIEPKQVLLFNNKNDEVPPTENSNYLVKCHIETGNVIDCIIVI